MVECGSRLGLEHPRESIRLVRKGPRESETPQPCEDANNVYILEKCYEISGVNTPEELLELLTRIREFNDGQLQEVEVLQDVERAKALLTEQKRKLHDIKHDVSARRIHIYTLYTPSYRDIKEKTPKLGKREREERRNIKLLETIGSTPKQLYCDSLDHVASGSDR